MSRILLLIAFSLLTGCVNLHVYFPEAPGQPAESAPAEEEK
jgi:hypothetical protein